MANYFVGCIKYNQFNTKKDMNFTIEALGSCMDLF